MEVYLVGGAVRDELLGLTVAERDWVVVGAGAEELLARGYKPVGKGFPVFLHPHSKEEYALARTERKKGRGYHGFQIYASPKVSLEEDLLRRDLTINAMAKNESGEIIDPYGGRRDLRDKRLRHVSDAFTEDPLRVLRVARFAARFASLGFTIADETLQLMRRVTETGELAELTPERIWQETENALATASPGEFFTVLHAVHALTQTHPVIGERLMDERARDRGLTCLNDGVKRLPPHARFAAFIGGLYFENGQDRGGRERARHAVRDLTRQLRLPKACKELLILTVTLQRPCHRAFDLDERQLLELLHELDARRRPERLATLLDIFSTVYRSVTSNNEYSQADWLRRAAKAVADVNATEWQGLNGEELAGNLKQAQLKRLAEFIKEKT